MSRLRSPSVPAGPLRWLRVATATILVGLIAAAWRWLPLREMTEPGQFSVFVAPLRHAWYALPLVVTAFVLLGLSLIPVLLLIAATGIAFGPVLGPIYAMAGCLTSASVGFVIGRWLGPRRMRHLGGERVARISRALERNGTLAVFLLRKVPAPFMLANIVVGASGVRYRDFIVGTLLGMGAFIIALAGFGSHLVMALHERSAVTVLSAAAFVGVPLALAWYINRTLRRKRSLA